MPDAAPAARYPSLYQINTRVWLTERSRALGRPATLDDIPDAELDDLGATGFDWVWLLGVWQTGPAGRQVSRTNPEWRREFQRDAARPARGRHRGLRASRSPGTRCTPDLGGDEALARLRERLRERGLRLMLDFVPNHMALDHPGSKTHPEYYVRGAELDLLRAPAELHLGPAAQAATCCWPTAAIRTSRAGRTRCSSTTPTRRSRRR